MSASSYRVQPFQTSSSDVQLSIRLPSSKSLANRVFVLAALSRGDFHISGDFGAEDVQLMLSALQTVGISVHATDSGVQIVNDLSWLDNDAEQTLYLGNSGTCVRFLTTLMCLRRGPTVLTGKMRMKERPISDLVDALRSLGMQIDYLEQEGYPPVRINSSIQTTHQTTISGAVSSQFLTSLLLSASGFEKGMTVGIEGELISRPYVDLTTGLLQDWGVELTQHSSVFEIPFQELLGNDWDVEGDASAAVYWWAFSMIHGVSVDLLNLPEDSRQGDCRFKNLLDQLSQRQEKVLLVLSLNDMPDASLMLMAMAPLYHFPIRIEDIGSLRVKETDRLEAMKTELMKCGVQVTLGNDWIEIEPLDLSAYDASQAIEVETYDDHRIAMSMAILGTKLGNFTILDPECVQKSYPHFWNDLDSVY